MISTLQPQLNYLSSLSPFMRAMPLSYVVVKVSFVTGAIGPYQLAIALSLVLLEFSSVAEARGPLKTPSPAPSFALSDVALVDDASLVLDGSEEGLEAAGAAAAGRRGWRACRPLRGLRGDRPSSPSGSTPRGDFRQHPVHLL